MLYRTTSRRNQIAVKKWSLRIPHISPSFWIFGETRGFHAARKALWFNGPLFVDEGILFEEYLNCCPHSARIITKCVGPFLLSFSIVTNFKNNARVNTLTDTHTHRSWPSKPAIFRQAVQAVGIPTEATATNLKLQKRPGVQREVIARDKAGTLQASPMLKKTRSWRVKYRSYAIAVGLDSMT